MSTPLEVFCCYAREDHKMLAQLTKHLMPMKRQGLITIWSDININAGVEWEKELYQHLESTDIFLLLISPDFLSSDYCSGLQMQRAMERHDQDSAHVIPVLLRSVAWKSEPFAKLQVVPTDAKPVTQWSDQDDAFHDITEHINRIVTERQMKQNGSSFLPKTGEKEGENLISHSRDHSERTSPLMLPREEERFVSYLQTPPLAALFNQIAGNQNAQTMQEAYNHPDLLTTAHIEEVLGTLLDPMAFPDLHEFARGLKQAYLRVQRDNVTSKRSLILLLGAIGLVCFTLELLDMAQRQNQNASSFDLDWPQTLFKEPAVRHWFKQVYAPPQNPSNPQQTQEQEDEKLKLARKHWQELDFDGLELYRVGTTSFILRCQIPLLAGERLVLKCLLFPYTRIPAITDTTQNYSLPSQGRQESATVRILSSTSKWILMDFIDGLNLREFLQKRRRAEGLQTPFLRTDLLVSLGKPLLTALASLYQASLHHEDLTPSNIMVHEKPDGSIDHITLIDIGRNYLYTRHVGIEASREALFVAPEIKAGQKTEETSDLYSFGMILIELADPVGVQGGIIPESLYQYTPHVARFIEDLIDAKPEHRWLIFPLRDGKDPYDDLCYFFENLLKTLPSEREMKKPGKFSWSPQLLSLFYPARQWKHARNLRRLTHSSSMRPEIANHAGWLFGWLFMNMFTFWVIFGLSLVPFSLSIPSTLAHGCSGMCLPFFSIYGSGSFPMRSVGLSIGLIQSAYYTNILAGLTTRSMRGKLASTTEFFMRFQTLIALPLIAFGNLVQPGWWLALLILGLPIPTLVNLCCYRLAIRTLKRARGVFSTIPLTDDPSLENFGQWWLTLFYYIIMLCILLICLHYKWLHDALFYVFIILVLHVCVLCISKSIILAPGVRGCLSRAFTIGERLEALTRKSKKTY